MAEKIGQDTVQDIQLESAISSSDSGFYMTNGVSERSLIWKQDLRIVPLTAGIYLLCYLDRSNIGNAKIMNADTGNDLLTETRMDDHHYIISLILFLIAYALFEVPSNYLLKKLRPSRWIAFLMCSWGAVTAGLAGSHNFATVSALRFILGAAEAGLFPGFVFYLTFWYKNGERSLRVAIILASATLAGAFGGAIAYGVGHMNGIQGISAWRWLFIIEGLPSVASSLLILFFLPDYPETANWLTPEEKELAIRRLEGEGSQGGQSMTWQDAKETLTNWPLYAHYILYFGISVPFSSLSLFTPSITAGLGYEGLQAQLMTVPPYAVAIPPLLGWLSANLNTTAAAGLAIALNVSFGAPGQIVGVWIYKSNEAIKGYPTGHWTNAALLFLTFVGSLLLRWYYIWVNSKRRAQQTEARLASF
ncbi:hypothetical protein KEM56_001650 [Ascosphaera pollenicola]|nr:hypothetical protein KEM56_001650 [Ascosphaera pollenicola]